jgi:hypothetical protein
MGAAWAMASIHPARYIGVAPRGVAHVIWDDGGSRVRQVTFNPDEPV